MEDVLLSAKFVLYPKTTSAEVVLTNSAIVIKSTNSKPDSTILLNDLIGCHVLQGNKTTGARWYICVFSYPLKKKFFKGLTRVRMARSLGVSCGDDTENSKAVAEKWKKVLKYLISGKTVTSSQVDDVADIPDRKFVVYINPFSGRGKAMDIYQSSVKPMFAEAEIKHTVVKTEYAGHAKTLVKELEVEKYDGIIIVSGDGLIHEVINGLMERSDWETAIKTPLGIVPGGSGNALAASIVYASTGLHPQPSLLWSSLFEICRGNVEALDILSVETSPSQHEERKTLYAALGCVIGIISDVDIESERLRFLGGTLRSNIYGAMRIAKLRKYNLTLSYLPMEDTNSNVEQTDEDTPPEANSKSKHNPLSSENNQDSFIPAVNDLLVPLSEPVPPSWQTLENSFLQVSALNLSHLAGDIIVHSTRKLADGQILLTMLKSSMTRLAVMKQWELLENGTGLSNLANDVVVVPCRAFRIVPHTNHSKIITIDGEKLPYGAFQCQIHKNMMRVFCCN